jgi:hypothetical protein
LGEEEKERGWSQEIKKEQAWARKKQK